MHGHGKGECLLDTKSSHYQVKIQSTRLDFDQY